jgi:putative endonuclease
MRLQVGAKLYASGLRRTSSLIFLLLSPPVMKTYYVYIMASRSKVLYTGVTNNLTRRTAEHREARTSGFSARYSTRYLVYFELFGNIRAAIAREKQIKGWLRAKKLALIQRVNPSWKDLSTDL